MSTKTKLIDATLLCLRERGVTSLSARGVAEIAGVNQALIFYHFGSMPELVAAANEAAVAEATALYRNEFAGVNSLRELLDVGRGLHEDQAARGNVAVMAQLMAAGQQDEAFAAIAAAAFDAWVAEVERPVVRVLGAGALANVVDAPQLARAICASFIGLELYEGVDPDGAAGAFDSLQELIILADAIDSLGPVARKAVTAARRRAARRG